MERGMLLNDKHQLWDIKDGTAIIEIQDPDGKIFMDGLKRSNLQLAWSLSIDWFNPQGNKTENVYLVGVIPGPKEPSLEEINHFL